MLIMLLFVYLLIPGVMTDVGERPFWNTFTLVFAVILLWSLTLVAYIASFKFVKKPSRFQMRLARYVMAPVFFLTAMSVYVVLSGGRWARLDSGEHEVEVVYEAQPYLLGAFGEREPILPSVESVKVTPELAEDDLERFRDALVKGGYESWMQLLHDLGYKEKEYKWGCQYVLKARVAADGSLIRD